MIYGHYQVIFLLPRHLRMNLFKKVESFLEEVDQQAATSLNRPASASKMF